MKLGYTGDCVLQDSSLETGLYFRILKNELQKVNCRLIVNLESPFVKGNEQAIKNKITLSATPDSVNLLDSLEPYLINLANNHINDYGNESVLFTQEILRKHHFNYWGVGYKDEKNSNIHIDSFNRVVNIAYVTRSSDFTGSCLFAAIDFIGGFSPDLEQIKQLHSLYKDYVIIVSIHWGMEDISYPEPEKRKLAHSIIDAGADLIIGHHPHIIQCCECYKGKTIYYSIGNFFFPAIEYKVAGKTYRKEPLKHQRIGLIPIIEIDNGRVGKIVTWKIHLLEAGELVWDTKTKLHFINVNMYIYRLFFRGYRAILFQKKTYRFLRRFFFEPKLCFAKILNKIKEIR